MQLAPQQQQGPLPTEAERRHVFFSKAENWDREVLGIGRFRRQLVQQAHGNVLEVAAGTGRNFRYYDKKKVQSLTVADFCSSMLQQAKAKEHELEGIETFFLLGNACKLPKPSKPYDTIVQTFALCSYEDPVKTLKALSEQLQPADLEVVSLKRKNFGTTYMIIAKKKETNETATE
ncbi:methyltransferase domain-containing protein, putative [Eimeria brunetti]|uniref:Methyltransferase domain-containing protein, putative n=1 Tax=Eimeria brunetti TaxID=51314 RepID=U6LGC4_9EIME|nr:methyltransferase domain-containing protein, putative [Eimeria brunetti]